MNCLRIGNPSLERRKTGESDPQASGEERLMRLIPVIRADYYCYYLI